MARRRGESFDRAKKFSDICRLQYEKCMGIGMHPTSNCILPQLRISNNLNDSVRSESFLVVGALLLCSYILIDFPSKTRSNISMSSCDLILESFQEAVVAPDEFKNPSTFLRTSQWFSYSAIHSC